MHEIWVWLSLMVFVVLAGIAFLPLIGLGRFRDGHEYLEIVDRIYRHRLEQAIVECKEAPNA